jgi:ribosomal protein S18 acetylase RimI-like enzyme
MRIVDLRQVNARQLEPLFQAEQRRWLSELRWDYRPSIELIRKFIEARSLAGFAALEGSAPLGYGFYVLEERKGLIGDLFVMGERRAEVAQALLAQIVRTLASAPELERIEAQLMPFDTPFADTLEGLGFRLYPREFMVLDPVPQAAPPPAVGHLERWDDRHFQSCARLIQLAYAYHVDSEINDQYRSEAGALRFLRNIILLPGCGRFLRRESYVVREPESDRLQAAVLNSEVSPGVAHTTQIAVLPGHQQRGLGRRLMETVIAGLAARGFRALTLSVTAANERAVTLYRHLGFRTVKTFPAAVWKPE